MAFTVAIFIAGRSHWWLRVSDAITAALPGSDVLVFRGVDEWIGAAKGLAGEQVVLLGPRSAPELDVMLAAKELIRDKDLLVVLPRDLENLEARARELQPRIVITDAVRPEEVAEAVRKMQDRSRWRLKSWDWSDLDAVK